MIVLLFQPPADNERGPSFLEGLIAGWVAMAEAEGLALGLASRQGRLAFVVRVHEQRQRVIAAQILNAFPGSSSMGVISEQDWLRGQGAGDLAQGVSIVCKRHLRLTPDVLPLRLHHSFIEQHSREAIDPLEGLLEMLKSGRSGRISVVLWLQLRAVRGWRMNDANRCTPYLDGTFYTSLEKQGWARRRCCSMYLWKT